MDYYQQRQTVRCNAGRKQETQNCILSTLHIEKGDLKSALPVCPEQRNSEI